MHRLFSISPIIDALICMHTRYTNTVITLTAYENYTGYDIWTRKIRADIFLIITENINIFRNMFDGTYKKKLLYNNFAFMLFFCRLYFRQ